MSSIAVHCKDCGNLIEDEGFGKERKPCPKCGSLIRRIEVTATATVVHQASVRAKHKRPSLPSKDKLRADLFSGADLHRKSGKWFIKDRVIDRDKDYYLERVVDPETGKVIHECEEKLSEHKNHGSAKKKP